MGRYCEVDAKEDLQDAALQHSLGKLAEQKTPITTTYPTTQCTNSSTTERTYTTRIQCTVYPLSSTTSTASFRETCAHTSSHTGMPPLRPNPSSSGSLDPCRPHHPSGPQVCNGTRVASHRLQSATVRIP